MHMQNYFSETSPLPSQAEVQVGQCLPTLFHVAQCILIQVELIAHNYAVGLNTGTLEVTP